MASGSLRLARQILGVDDNFVCRRPLPAWRHMRSRPVDVQQKGVRGAVLAEGLKHHSGCIADVLPANVGTDPVFLQVVPHRVDVVGGARGKKRHQLESGLALSASRAFGVLAGRGLSVHSRVCPGDDSPSLLIEPSGCTLGTAFAASKYPRADYRAGRAQERAAKSRRSGNYRDGDGVVGGHNRTLAPN